MPRPYPPPLLPPPTVRPFQLGDAEQRGLAHVLGLEHLPPRVSGAIAAAIASYKATEAGSADTTIGNTLAELAELNKKGRVYDKAVKRIADDRSGVDYTTHGVLQHLAQAVLANSPGAREALTHAVDLRVAELRVHKRVNTETESLRFFCGVLRLIFNHDAAPALRSTTEEGWHHCRQFAMEVFTAADIDHADFDAHPERLTEYLGTDVSPP